MPSDGEKRVDFALKRLKDGEASRSDSFAVARDLALEDRETVVEHHLRHGADESALASPDAALDPDAAHRKQEPRVGLPVAHVHDGKIVVHVRPDADRLSHHLEEEGFGQLSIGTPVGGEDAVGIQIRLGRDIRLAHADDAGDDAHGLPVREIAFRIKKFGLGGFRHGFVPFRNSVRR